MSDIGSKDNTQTKKNYFSGMQQTISTTASNVYTEFRKHPTYYIGSTAMRLAIGAGVGYGMYYGLTALAAPYLAATVAPVETAIATTNQVISPIMKQLFGNIPNLNIPNMTAAIPQLPTTVPSSLSAFANLIPKAISAVSALGSLLASTKLSDKLLTRIFGEVKLKVSLNKEDGENVTEAYIKDADSLRGILNLFGQKRPYVTPVSDITTQIEKKLTKEFKDSPDLLPQSKMLAFAYTKKLVEANKSDFHKFDADAKAAVNAEPYVSAAKKAGI